MVRDLLDFTQARLGGGITVSPRPADLHEVTRQMVDEVQTAFPEREVRFIASGDGRGSWDPDRLGQIVSNLVTNALSYSPPDTPGRGADAPAERPERTGAGSWLVLEVHNLGDPSRRRSCPGCSSRSSAAATTAGIPSGASAWACTSSATWSRPTGAPSRSSPGAGYGTSFRVHLPRGGR